MALAGDHRQMNASLGSTSPSRRDKVHSITVPVGDLLALVALVAFLSVKVHLPRRIRDLM